MVRAVGAKIPADLRLIELMSSTLKVDQARLAAWHQPQTSCTSQPCQVLVEAWKAGPWGLRVSAPGVQSILTGESSTVDKILDAARVPNAVYQDKTCLLFSVRRCFELDPQPGAPLPVH